MKRRNLILILASTTALSALALTAARARDVPKVAIGFVANVVCTETFVSGLDPARVFAETTSAMPGVGLISWALDYRVDRARKDVTVTLFGLGRSYAVYRGESLGCHLDHGGAVVDISVPAPEVKAALLPDIAGPSIVAPQTPPLAAALDRAFAEPDKSTLRNTRAIVVMKDGRVVAERYAAASVSIRRCSDSPPPIGDLGARRHPRAQGRTEAARAGADCSVARRRRCKARHHARSSDPSHRRPCAWQFAAGVAGVRAGAGQPDEIHGIEYGGLCGEHAAESTPGTAWNYHDGNTVILSHVIRQASGGSASRMMRFARQELFDPLGMRHVTLEFDASGNAEGSSQMLASARDWARFGQLYLNDGTAGGKRILPEGWVKYTATPTPTAWVGQGAGFWTNLGDSFGATYRTEHGWPRDAFFAKGTIGQYVIIVPSERLVIVRLGRSPNGRRKPTACSISCAMWLRRREARRNWRARIDG